MRAWLLGLAAVVAACGGSSGGDAESADTAPPAAGDTTGTTTGAVADTEAAETTNGDGEETLADFLGWNVDPEDSEAYYQEQEQRIQEMIAACMTAEGFEYVPFVYPTDGFVDPYAESTPEEYAAEFGLGVSTWIGREDQFGTDSTGPEVVDPNQEIRESLSESEAEAYDEALWGDPEDYVSETDPVTGDEYQMPVGGCQNDAYDEIYANDAYTEIQPELDAFFQRVEADPRIVEANARWAECMAAAGYPYDDHEAMYTDFQTRTEEVAPNGGYPDPFAGMTEEEIQEFIDTHTEEEMNDLFENAEPTYDEAALAALQAEEIEVALADVACTEDLTELYETVNAEYEAEFIAENRAELEAIRDAQSGA